MHLTMLLVQIHFSKTNSRRRVKKLLKQVKAGYDTTGQVNPLARKWHAAPTMSEDADLLQPVQKQPRMYSTGVHLLLHTVI